MTVDRFQALRTGLRNVTPVETREAFCSTCNTKTIQDRFFGDDPTDREGFGYGNHPVHYSVTKCPECGTILRTQL